MRTLLQVPCWYVAIALLWSAFQGFRGATEHRLSYEAKVRSGNEWVSAREPPWETWERWVVLYIHDFAFRFICTAAGFVALAVAYNLAGDASTFRQLSSGEITFVGFLFLLGIIGIGGQLHYAILLGRVPR